MKTITPTIQMMRMLASVRGHQWNIMPSELERFALTCLDSSERIGSQSEASIEFEDFFNIRPAAMIDANGIGHVWIQEALIDQYPPVYEKLGMITRYSTIQSEAETLIASGAKGMLFHVDSPGGTVAGCAECADFISSIEIPTIGYASGLACSAAYKLISSCNTVIASKTAQVGNIGSIMSWADCTEFWREMGIEMKALTSEGATLKSTFHLEPNAEQLAFLQESLNESGKAFRDHVTAARAKAGVTLDEEVFRAGWYSGDRALELGLVDDISSVDEALALFSQSI